MTGVVLRCPNCGTTRAAPRECDACREAQFRSYCTNHAPGLWLNAVHCPQRGVRLGDPPKMVSPPAPTVLPRRAAPSAPAAVPRRAPAPPPPAAPRPKFSAPVRSRDADRRERTPPVIDKIGLLDEERPMRATSWREVFSAAARARSRRLDIPPYPDATHARRGMGGCLG